MDSLWEVIKNMFFGIFNLFTLLGIFAWLSIYFTVWEISTYQEGEDLSGIMRLIASVQLRLGKSKKKLKRKIARWLWKSLIMHLDIIRRCRLARLNEEKADNRIWLIHQFGKCKFDDRIFETCRNIAAKENTPKLIVQAAEDSMKKLEISKSA